jgi:integrase
MASIERRSGKHGDVFVVRFRDDQRRQRSKSLHSHAEAARFANKVEVQLAEGDWIDPSKGNTKFRDFHARWVSARSVSPSREATERSHANNHILPTWGDTPLRRIRPLDIERWIKDSTAGPTTKAMMLAQLRLCLDGAVREGLIRSNPASAIRAPALPRKRVNSSDVLDADELQRLVEAMPDRWRALVYLSGWLGWRWSEAMGLQIQHVDFERGLIDVGARTIVESEGRLYVKEGGKTDAATRVIPLPQPALDALEGHIHRHLSDPSPAASLFVTEGGYTPLRSNFRRIFNRAVRESGLAGRGINMRQLRHTGASLMLSAGLDLIDVQQRLGHARGSTTLDTYARVLARRRSLGNELLGAQMRLQPSLRHDEVWK